VTSERDGDPLILLGSVVLVGEVDRVCSGDLISHFGQCRSLLPSRFVLWTSEGDISNGSLRLVGAAVQDSPGARSPLGHTEGYHFAILFRALGTASR
jgi:hypothetical protein